MHELILCPCMVPASIGNAGRCAATRDGVQPRHRRHWEKKQAAGKSHAQAAVFWRKASMSSSRLPLVAVKTGSPLWLDASHRRVLYLLQYIIH
jgi:hypothetical protein